MSIVIQVEVPDAFRQVMDNDHDEATLTRWALEALVSEAVREGIITRGLGGELLGLGFHQREEFFFGRGVTYDLSDDDLVKDRKALQHILPDQ